jgi:hypothetical protein
VSGWLPEKPRPLRGATDAEYRSKEVLVRRKSQNGFGGWLWRESSVEKVSVGVEDGTELEVL